MFYIKFLWFKWLNEIMVENTGRIYIIFTSIVFVLIKISIIFMSLMDFYKIYILKFILHLGNSIIIYFASKKIDI
jgi:hypothetical protein